MSLKEVNNNNFKSFKLKTSFLKTRSKIIILLPARGKMCNSTVWCSKVLCLEMLMCVSCHYKKDDIKFTIKLQNKFLYFCHQISLYFWLNIITKIIVIIQYILQCNYIIRELTTLVSTGLWIWYNNQQKVVV